MEFVLFRRWLTRVTAVLDRFKKGDLVTEFSDNLLMFHLKGFRSYYRDSIGDAPIGPSVINLTVNTSPASPRLINTTKALPVSEVETSENDDDDSLPVDYLDGNGKW